ncbi:Uncharacterised protein [uncultured archaeon]|nr:Uncharacterised protein [uncultured archaeon]
MDILAAASAALPVLAVVLGWTLLALFAASAVLILLVLLLLLYQLRTGNCLFPNQLVAGIDFFESPLRVVLRMLKISDVQMDLMAISLKNQAMDNAFRKVPFDQRAIFLPQCLRSVNCRAVLSPEGIRCLNCGACGIAQAKREADRLGCMLFVVPGSSFIGRMIEKYRPKAVIGVGCLHEVRNGLDMMHKIKMPTVSVLLDRFGCVDTKVDWSRLFSVMNATDDQPRACVPEKDSNVASS